MHIKEQKQKRKMFNFSNKLGIHFSDSRHNLDILFNKLTLDFIYYD